MAQVFGVQNALISVYDKTDIEEFARGLIDQGWTLYSTTGTFKRLNDAKIPVHDVADLTGWGAMLDHRVVTLHPKVHGGILADTSKPDHLKDLKDKEIPLFELVCVDLYPLEEEIADPKATQSSIIEKIDIGGPTMLNGAAKSGRIVLSRADQRPTVLKWLQGGKPDETEFREKLAAIAFYETTRYYMQIAKNLDKTGTSGHIARLHSRTKYGESPQHTTAGVYADNRVDIDPLGIDQFKHVKGWEKSYINETDIDRLLQTTTHIAAGFDLNFGEVPPLAAGVKHGNVCGAGVAKTHAEAVRKMLQGDSRAIFGGVVMINGVIDADVAEALMNYLMEHNYKRTLDGVVGADVTEEALEMLSRKKMRVVTNPALTNLGKDSLDSRRRFRYVRGGVVEQDNYTFVMDLSAEYMDTYGKITSQQKHDFILAWGVGATSNSNTITLAKNGMVIGNGVGQQDRIGAAQLALQRTTIELPDMETTSKNILMKIKLDKAKLSGAVAYSDSFFPFPDGPMILADAGIKAILTSSGSINDKIVIPALTEAGVSLILVPDKIGRGFFGH